MSLMHDHLPRRRFLQGSLAVAAVGVTMAARHGTRAVAAPQVPTAPDWLAWEYRTVGATAYASSFTYDTDPRDVIMQAHPLRTTPDPAVVWRPHADDPDPRFYITWPGCLPLDRLVLTGTIPEGVGVRVGLSRNDMTDLAVTRTDAAGTTVLTAAAPVIARVAELHFPAGAEISLHRVSCPPVATPPPAAVVLSYVKGQTSPTATVRRGDTVAFSVDPALLGPAYAAQPAGNPTNLWWIEVERRDSSPYRLYKDFRAIRALVAQQGSSPLHGIGEVLGFATSGTYDVWVSWVSTNLAPRIRLGTVTVEGIALPTWPAGHRPGFPEVTVDNTTRRLPSVRVNEEEVPGIIMVLGSPTFEQFAAYRQTGARLWRFNLTAGALLAGSDLAANVARALDETEVSITNLMAHVPDAYVMLGLDTRPSGTWITRYGADNLAKNAAGKGSGVNFGSAQLRADLVTTTRAYMSGLAAKPYADRIIAVQPYFGRGGDGWGYGISEAGWVQRDQLLLGDYAPAEERGFATWLENKYGTPLSVKLAEAWPAPALDRATRTPTDDRLASVDRGLFIDPVSKRDVVDYWDFRGDSIVETILLVGEEVQAASGGRLLYGGHYGYTMGTLRNQAPGVAQLGGHHRLRKMLTSPASHLVNGGSSGDKRDSTANYECVSAIGSAAIHDRMVILELDNRTPLTRGAPPYEYYQLFSFDSFLNGARKDLGYAMTHGAAIHWYDMSQPYQPNIYFREPWYAEPSFYSLVQEAMRKGVEPVAQPRRSSLQAPVTIFIDERTVSYQDVYDSFVWENLTRYLTESFADAGVGYRFVLLEDYATWATDPAARSTQLEIFLNGWVRRPDEWPTIVASPRAQLWLYGASILSDAGIPAAPPTSELFGFDLQAAGPLAIEDSVLHPTPVLDRHLAPWGNHPYDPVVHAAQRDLFGESLAEHYVPGVAARGPKPYRTLATFASGAPGLTESWVSDRRRLFCSLPYLTTAALQAVYRRIGINIDVPTGDWWIERGRGAVSVNTKASVTDPQALERWLAGQEVVLGPGTTSTAPGRSWVVRA